MDPAWQQLAATWLGRLASQLQEELDGVRAARDVECVHRARVASRRLRSLLRLLGEDLAPERLTRWRKGVRRVTQALGSARDMDVHLEFLTDQLAGLSKRSRCPGVAMLLADFEQRRADCQPKLLTEVSRLRRKGVLKEMVRHSEATLADPAIRDAKAIGPDALDRAQTALSARWDELVEWEWSLADPEDRESHHAMRIAAKRLRYTIELVAPAFEGRLDESLGRVKRLQALLGDLHDCDVWIDELAAFNKAQRKRVKRAYGRSAPHARIAKGLKHLGRVCRKRRGKTFRELTRFWSDLPDLAVWSAASNRPEQKEVCGQERHEPTPCESA